MKLAVAIPAYNRPDELAEALASLAPQMTRATEIVIAEDRSPRRAEIAEVVAAFRAAHPDIALTYIENAVNLGYDGNLRSLLRHARADYVLFMGDDDRLPQGAIGRVLAVVAGGSYGVILRGWRSFDGATGAVQDSHRYFDGDRRFDPGVATVAAFFRRSVFISGLIVARMPAAALDTDQFDGLLLYQLYLVGHLLQTMPGFYIDDVIAERRSGGEHFFGSAAAEAGKFEAGKLTPDHSLRFLSGLFRLAAHLDEGAPGIGDAIRRDLGRYSYPMLEIQALRQPRGVFARYGWSLARLGLGRQPLFWAYFGGLLTLGPRICSRLIAELLARMGSTPVLGGASGERA